MSRRTYRVMWTTRTLAGVDRVHWVEHYDTCHEEVDVEAASPEEAGAEALLRTYRGTRPAGAPERIEVDGAPYRVDEWVEAAVYLVLAPDEPAPSACVDRGLKHLRLARRALRHFDRLSGPEARRARGIAAELDELGARLEVLRGDLIAPGAGGPR